MASSLQLPIIDLTSLNISQPSSQDLAVLSKKLGDVFETVGFAYLVNAPLNFDHGDVFGMAEEFFAMPDEEKLRLAKKSFRKENGNTYRGYFPAQSCSDNLKEGFEIGPPDLALQHANPFAKINLTEANVWPGRSAGFTSRSGAEALHMELQALSVRLLSILAVSLKKTPEYFASYSENSLSTLRFLHYPAITPPSQQQELCCTPHTDSGILTLLHQDPTGGLEVLSADGEWIGAPYVPGSIVVNVGDLMTKISGGRFKATYHRVRSSPGKGRYSVPFFFEPGVDCVLTSVDKTDEEGVYYGQHVLEKMKGWIEFRDLEKDEGIMEMAVEVGEGAE